MMAYPFCVTQMTSDSEVLLAIRGRTVAAEYY
jgi:hypothetical protein